MDLGIPLITAFAITPNNGIIVYAGARDKHKKPRPLDRLSIYKGRGGLWGRGLFFLQGGRPSSRAGAVRLIRGGGSVWAFSPDLTPTLLRTQDFL